MNLFAFIKSHRRHLYFLALIILPLYNSYAQNRVTPDSTATDTTQVESKSGYHSLETDGGVGTVNADLRADDALKMQWLKADASDRIFKRYYGLKKKMKEKYRVAVGTDYMFLNQLASFSYSDRVATSGIFRFFGTWDALVSEKGNNGSFIFKIENRHKIGNQQIPRDLGYETGSALSTASFKDFSWGLTNFYWKQSLYNGRLNLVVGLMDPGDWVDLYPLLNAYKYYLNEAYFNSPTMALPSQGIGISGGFTFAKDFYFSGGMHDANGDPTNFLIGNFESFFGQNEYFYWVEAGWKQTRSPLGGETVHLSYWYQDAREEEGTVASKGLSFSASQRFGSYIPFIRAGINEGNAALMHHMVMAGVGIDAFRGDNLGIAFNWGGPTDRSKRDQFSIELYYAIQLTQHINIMPDIQLTKNPSFNDTQDLVAVYSTIRIRYAM